MSTSLTPIIERGLRAAEAGQLDEAEALLDEAQTQGGENHPEVLHLAGIVAWSRGDMDHATGYLMQAVDADPADLSIYLDCAECLLAAGEDPEQAEDVITGALESLELEGEERDEALLMLAQVRLQTEEPETAMEALEGISEERRDHAAYLSTRARVWLESGDVARALADLERAVVKDPSDGDLYYQLGEIYRQEGNEAKARAAFVSALELDLAASEDVDNNNGSGGDVPFDQVQELRTTLEGVLDELPEPLLRLLASAPITVQSRLTPSQVLEEGLDPRSSVVLRGTPRSDDAEPELSGLVVLRDVLFEAAGSVDEVDDILATDLGESVVGFFGLTDVSLG